MKPSKQIEGQMSIFDFLNPRKEPIFRKYPGCTYGDCPVCGNNVFYDATYGRNPNPWVAREPICEVCGCSFDKNSRPDKELPTLCGISNQPIVLTIDYTGYTQADIDKHGGIEWLRKRRCTEWFSARDTKAIDDYITEQELRSKDEIIRYSAEHRKELSIKLLHCHGEPKEMFRSCKEYFVKCPVCGRRTKMFKAMYLAMEAWNKEIEKERKREQSHFNG